MGMITDTDISERLTFQLSVVNMFVEIVRQIIKNKVFEIPEARQNVIIALYWQMVFAVLSANEGLLSAYLEKDFAERNLSPANGG